MNLWFSSTVPAGLIHLIAPVCLMVVGHVVEKNYVGRITAFANAIAINIFLYNLPNIHPFLIFYANAALILGVFGFLAYFISQSLPQIYYILIWSLSSFIVGGIMLVLTFGGV